MCFQMMILKKISLGIVMISLFTQFLHAEANIIRDKKLMQSELIKVAGDVSRYNQEESFPHDYFLIPKNLPYAFKIVLYHPQSSELGLSKEKIQILVELKKKTKPKVIKKAKEIKALELTLVNLIEEHKGKAILTDKINNLIDKIAFEKSNLSKIHVQCILNVQSLLSIEEKRKSID